MFSVKTKPKLMWDYFCLHLCYLMWIFVSCYENIYAFDVGCFPVYQIGYTCMVCAPYYIYNIRKILNSETRLIPKVSEKGLGVCWDKSILAKIFAVLSSIHWFDDYWCWVCYYVLVGHLYISFCELDVESFVHFLKLGRLSLYYWL